MMRAEFSDRKLLPPTWDPQECPVYGLDPELDRALCVELRAVAIRRQYKTGQDITFEGGPRKIMMSIISGHVSLSRALPNSERMILGLSGPGGIIGVVDLEEYEFSTTCLTDVSVYCFPAIGMRRLWRRHATLKRLFFQLLGSFVRANSDHIVMLGRKNAIQRMATFLIERPWQGRFAPVVPDEDRVPMSRGDMADFLGLTNETVSRVLRGLERRGLISVRNVDLIRILDRDRLIALKDGVADN